MSIAYHEAVTFLASFTFVFWETSQETGSSFREYYNSRKNGLSVPIAGQWFGIIWFALKVMISLALFFFLRNNVSISIAIFSVWIINEVLRKMWTSVFMDYKMPRVALVICYLILATAGAVVIMLGINQDFLPMGLMIPYALWSGFACWLNYDWVAMEYRANYEKMGTKWKTAL